MLKMMNRPGCSACRHGVGQPFPFTMAFQPIVDVEANSVYAFEALVRGVNGSGAATCMRRVTSENRYAFDQSCRVTAIELASRLHLPATGARLSINFMPGAVYSPSACIQLTLRAAEEYGFPSHCLVFEVTEGEEVTDRAHLRSILAEYRRRGFQVALDDFGAGYSGLNLLADCPADLIKLDMELTRNIDQRPAARKITQAMVALCERLGSRVVAEGVETPAEYRTLRDCGVDLMQGYLLARPGLEQLPEFRLP